MSLEECGKRTRRRRRISRTNKPLFVVLCIMTIVTWRGNESGNHVSSFAFPPHQRSVMTSSRKQNSLSMLDTPATDFELQVGRALDTLRADYPNLLTTPPDYSLYDPQLLVVDPSGVQVKGLASYKNAFRLLHALVKCIYCPSRSQITFRMCYDKARQNIRIHWNAVMMPRFVRSSQLHVDGISVYEVDKKTGHIVEHRIEHLLMNSEKVQPEEGVIAALQAQHAVTVPSFCRDPQIAQFQSLPPQVLFTSSSNNNDSLFAMEASDDQPVVDYEALERKNKSRKKFGLKPLSVEEFLQVEADVQQLELQQQQRLTKQQQQDETETGNPLVKALQNFSKENLQDTCESNFDCERPTVCCDFGFRKMCCSSGSLVGLKSPQLQPRLVPVPVDVQDPRQRGDY